MNRAFSILLSLVYLLSTGGVVVHYHFCCGKLASVSIVEESDRCCDHDWPDQPAVQKKCCSWEELIVEVSDGLRTSATVKAPIVAATSVVWAPSFSRELIQTIRGNTMTRGEDPPPIVRVYARLSQYVYYG